MKFKFPLLPIECSISKAHKPINTTIEKTYNKVFAIGLGKTGTSSLAKFFQTVGLKLGNQTIGELLTEEVADGKLERLFKLCETADAFQDLPFMMDVYQELDLKFPNSKFILTERDSPEQWYRSLTQFHTKKFSSDKDSLPTKEDLAKSHYLYKGWALESFGWFWDYPNVALYDEEYYKEKYSDYNASVSKYFLGRENDFIRINVSKQNDFGVLCDFLNIKTEMTALPWENKT